jgi:hypothetical protein
VTKGLVALTATLAGLSWAAAALADVSFSDPAGDQRAAGGGGAEVARAGPDITRVDVSNGQDGVVTFRVTIANYRDLPPSAFLAIFFDLDRNLDTGDLGDEAQIGWSPAGGLAFERWDGQRFVAAPAGAILAAFAEGVFTLEIPRSDLGGVASFDFLVGSSALVNEMLATDIAPVLGSHWTYHLVLGPLTLRASSLVAVPARPVAGKQFTVSTAVTRSDTRSLARSGSVTCTASVGQATIRAQGRFASGRARCVLTVPRTAGGKMLRGTVTVRVEGASVRRLYSFRVLAR